MPQENLHENTIELVWILYNKKQILRIRSESVMRVRVRIQMVKKSDPQKMKKVKEMYCFEVLEEAFKF
jgi:hypothetical protein